MPSSSSRSSGRPITLAAACSSITGGTHHGRGPRCRPSIRWHRTARGWRTSRGRASPVSRCRTCSGRWSTWRGCARWIRSHCVPTWATATSAACTSEATTRCSRCGKSPSTRPAPCWRGRGVRHDEREGLTKHSDPPRNMRSLIWGAGAIGGTLGAYLARAGGDVTLVDTVVEHVDAIARDGLRLTGPIDEFTVRVPAFTPQMLNGTWDEIILATKAHHTEPAVRALVPHLTPGGCVVSAQNGLNELLIAQVVGAARTVGAFVNFGADYLEPGVIHYAGHGAVVIGEIDGRITPRATAICDAWRRF